MPDSDFDLFTAERLKAYAAQDQFAAFSLRDKWEDERFLRAWFNTEIAENSQSMRIYKQVNGIAETQS